MLTSERQQATLHHKISLLQSRAGWMFLYCSVWFASIVSHPYCTVGKSLWTMQEQQQHKTVLAIFLVLPLIGLRSAQSEVYKDPSLTEEGEL